MGALVGADVAVDVEHRGQVRVRLVEAGHVARRHRGQQLFDSPGGSKGGDVTADRLDLRGTVQPQDPAQRDRVDPGGALGAGFTGQGPQHALKQHRVQAVEPVAQTPENLCRTRQQPGDPPVRGSPATGPPTAPARRGQTPGRRGSAAPTGPRPALCPMLNTTRRGFVKFWPHLSSWISALDGRGC